MNTRTKAGIAVGAAAIVLATGGVAAAATSHSTTGTGHKGGGSHHGGAFAARRIEHGQFVTKDPKTGAQVTHDVVNGTVTAVSSSSITVKAGDGTSESFVVNSSTKVHVKGQAKGTTGSIGAVKTGQQAMVAGTGTGPFTATRVLAR